MLLNGQSSLKAINPIIDNKDFIVKIADTEEELHQAYRLRFEVFNLELREGLDSSFEKGMDIDEYDEQFVHLVVISKKNNKVIATYRAQNYAMATQGLGFYSADRFDFDKFPQDVQQGSLETSRACVARPFRNSTVFLMLWKGLAHLMKENNIRYFFGCSSVQSNNPQDANGLVKLLQMMAAYHQDIYLPAAAGFQSDYKDIDTDISAVSLPPLFNIYLRFKCRVCSAPCFDKEFKTITFLILLDLDELSERTVEYFMTNTPKQ